MSRRDIRSARRLRKGRGNGKGRARPTKRANGSGGHTRPIFYLFIYLFIYTLPFQAPLIAAGALVLGLTGTFCPGAEPAWPSTGPARVFFNLHASSLSLPTAHSRALPTTPPVYQMELLDASLIPHRLSSSPDWRPVASLFVPALGRGHRHSPIKSILGLACPSPRLVDLDANKPVCDVPSSIFFRCYLCL